MCHPFFSFFFFRRFLRFSWVSFCPDLSLSTELRTSGRLPTHTYTYTFTYIYVRVTRVVSVAVSLLFSFFTPPVLPSPPSTSSLFFLPSFRTLLVSLPLPFRFSLFSSSRFVSLPLRLLSLSSCSQATTLSLRCASLDHLQLRVRLALWACFAYVREVSLLLFALLLRCWGRAG